MANIYCLSFVEDPPSAAVAKKLVNSRNAQKADQLIFREGFPNITGGYGEIKNKCSALLNMARSGYHTFILTDLDRAECAVTLIRDWFSIPTDTPIKLPKECIFRIAVREVEAWLLADLASWSRYIGIPSSNFSETPDDLDDPKQHLLNVVRRKGTKNIHRDMLPVDNAHIGPRYNEVLCNFVEKKWLPDRAAANSPSLARAFNSLLKL